MSESFFKPLEGIDYDHVEQTDNINGNIGVNVKDLSRGGSCT